jgi:hypothetical protein
MADNKILGALRTIFRRDRIGGEDSPRYRSPKFSTVYGTSIGYGPLKNQGSAFTGMDPTQTLEEDLLSRFADYEDMDEQAELNTALDIIADDATQTDSITNHIVHIDAEDHDIKKMLETCFHDNISIDENIWEICRTMCKYGNDYEEHVVTETEGLVGMLFLPTPQMRRIDDEEGSLLGFIYDRTGMFNLTTEDFHKRITDRNYNEKQYYEHHRNINVYEDWELTHFRLRSKYRGSQYGWSFLEAARWTVKRLMMLEDAALMYKLQRAPQRYVFNVDVGDLPPNEALRYLNQVKQSLKKSKIVDPRTGKLDLASNMIANDEDFFIPTRKDKPSMAVETVGGFDTAFYMDDLEYFKDKLYAAIKIPKDYLNFSEDSVSKANLSTQDIRWARTVIRIQRELRTGLMNMARVHLAALNHDPDMVDFNVYLTPPSSIFEMAAMEVRQSQLEIAEKYRVFVDDYWIMNNILKFSDDDIESISKRLKKQKEMENPFSENRFPKIEGRDMNPEVKKMLNDMGETAFMRDKNINGRLKELQGLAEEMKFILRKK